MTSDIEEQANGSGAVETAGAPAWVGRVSRGVVLAGLVGLSVILGVWVVLSLRWRMMHDTPVMHYQAWLMSVHDRVLYRDILAHNFPGTFLFHAAVGKLFGWGDLGFRIADLLWCSGLVACTVALLRRFHGQVAWAAILFWGFLYFGYGYRMSLQRDVVLILPTVAAVAAMMASRPGYAARCVISGVLVGLATTIKPQAALGLPVIVICGAFLEDEIAAGGARTVFRRVMLGALWSAVGFCLPLVAVVLWLAATGALSSFLDIARHFYPMYTTITGRDHLIRTGAARWMLQFRGLRGLGDHTGWLFAAALGTSHVLTNVHFPARLKRRACFLFAMMCIYGIYPMVGAQFFEYHWMPFAYFATACAALFLTPGTAGSGRRGVNAWQALLFTCMVIFLVHAPYGFRSYARGERPIDDREQQVDEMTAFLREHARPGDEVQPLDWIGGSLHAMLRTEIPLATRFPYALYFYVYPSDPFPQQLRREFLVEMEAARPRFIIDVPEVRTAVKGVYTTTEFPELDAWIHAHYVLVRDRAPKYRIFERRAASPPLPAAG